MTKKLKRLTVNSVKDLPEAKDGVIDLGQYLGQYDELIFPKIFLVRNTFTTRNKFIIQKIIRTLRGINHATK